MAEKAAPTPLPLGRTTPVFQQPGDCEDTSASTLKSEKSRRRGSLSISRFGQVRRIRWMLTGVQCSTFIGVHPFQIPENSVDVAPGQTGIISRSASALSSLALKSPLYAQPPVSFCGSIMID